ncbi:MAG TPA: TolC family protein, partial [Dongiaceae bacterium]|nr:TolC family protein [Dongiaceae bacterium]
GTLSGSVHTYSVLFMIIRIRARLVESMAILVVVLAARPTGAAPADSAATTAPESLRVADCVRLARASGPDVVAAALQYQAAQYDSIAAGTNGRPAFSIFGGVTIAPEGFYDPALTDLGSYEMKAGLALPLLDAGSRARARARGALNAVSQGWGFQQAARDGGLRAGSLALLLLRLREEETSLRETLTWLDRLTTLIGSGVRAGSRSRSDEVRVALESDEVKATLEANQRDAHAAARELNLWIGRPASATTAIHDLAPSEEHDPADEDSLRLLMATENLPELRVAETAEALGRVELEETRKRNALRADFFLDAGFWGSDLTAWVPPDLQFEDPGATFGDRLLRDLGASMGVTFRLPVLDASLSPETHARAASLRAASLAVAIQRDTQRRLSLDLFDRWRTAAERYAAAGTTVGLADDHLIQQKSLYAAGALTTLELLDARRLLVDARARLAEARFEKRLARMEAEARW